MGANRGLRQRLMHTFLTHIRISPLIFTLSALLGTLLLITLFELMKLSLIPDITLWESQAITIAFVTCVTTFAAYRLFCQYQKVSYYHERLTSEIVKRQHVESTLVQERSLLRMLMDNIPDPIYFKDAQTRFMRINGAAARACGMNDPQQAIGKTSFDFFPLEHAQSALKDEQQILSTGQAIVGKEECVTWPDCPSIWISTTKLPLRDEMGAVIGTFAISRDITEKKRVDIALKNSEEKYRAVIEQSADGIVLFDENGLIFEWNKAMENLTGLLKSEVMHRPMWTIEYQMVRDSRKNPALYKQFQEKSRKALSSSSISSHMFDTEIQRSNGIFRYVSITNFSVETSGGHLHGSIAHDITERKQAEEKLLYLSTHDTLTGLYNRTHFNDTLMQLNQVGNYPISVMMIDVDGMKRINDMLGHAAGDELLRRTAEVLMQVFRGDEVIARIGGDEFAVLLYKTSSEAARAVVERFRLKLCEHNGRNEGAPLSLSMGIATALAYGDLTQVIATADQRMYQDKDTHRD